jgi:hypothetical protein
VAINIQFPIAPESAHYPTRKKRTYRRAKKR